jgi:hypothetical protein
VVYTPTNWVDGATPLNRTNMKNIEDELALLDSRVAPVPPPTTASTPPGSPVDGQLWLFPVDAANGVIWQFRFNAGSASAYKWEFVGGPPLYARFDTSQGFSANTWTAGAPQLTIPRNGDFYVSAYAQFGCTNASQLYLGLALGATNPYGIYAPSICGIGGQHSIAFSDQLLTGLTSGVLLQHSYFSNAAGTSATYRIMSLLPARAS